MKKLVILLLAVTLAACSSPIPTEQPVAAPPEPTATPVVVVHTVVVEPTQAPTEPPPPNEAPPIATPMVVVVTVVVEQPTSTPVNQAAPEQPAANAPVTFDSALGRGVFTNMTVSSANLTLRCFPRELTFNVTTPNTDIRDVLLYYRVVDLKRLYPSEWKAFGKMASNGNGNFSIVFSGEDVHPNLRIDGSWLDFQFIGLAKSGNVVDRSGKIESQVKYTFDCP